MRYKCIKTWESKERCYQDSALHSLVRIEVYVGLGKSLIIIRIRRILERGVLLEGGWG